MSLKERLNSYLSSYKKGFNNTGAIRWMWKNDPILWNEIVKATSFLGSDLLPKQRCWHIVNDIWEIPVCKYSGEFVKWQGCKYTSYLGKGNNINTVDFRKAYVETSIKKYGVDNPAKSPQVQAKMKSTNLERYGSENYFSSEAGISMLKAEWANETKATQRIESIRKANQEKYGCHPAQVPEIHSKKMKTAFSSKWFIFPSGKTVQVQGCEPRALNELLTVGITEDDIITGADVPTILYDFQGKKKRYYPDIYIKSQNKLIEVKSTYFYDLHFEQNIAKQEACLNAGFLFEFKIY